MVDYLVTNFYPEIHEAFPLTNDQNIKMRARVMYEELVKSTVKMVADWQCYGFCHGVLNTDNMSMLGLTIDYGPYGFLEHYDPMYICNHSDNEGRYRYEAQPDICKWNLGKLAEALDPLLPLSESKAFLEENYDVFFKEIYNPKLAQKLGLQDPKNPNEPNMLACADQA